MKTIDRDAYDLKIHCRNQQHYLFEKKSPLLCRILGHKIHWEYVTVHEDIKEQTPDSIEVFSYNKEGHSITQDLLSMCVRCRLLFRREDGDDGLYGIVKIRRMDEPEIQKLTEVAEQ